MQSESVELESLESVEGVASNLFGRIIVPIDCEPHSREAVRVALALRKKFGSEIVVVTLTEFSANDNFLRGLGDNQGVGDLVRDAEERLVRFLDNVLPGASKEVTCRALVETDLARGIVLAAKRYGGTVVILRAHAHASLWRTNTENIVKELSLPVFLLK